MPAAADPVLTYAAPWPADRGQPEVRLERFPKGVYEVLHGQIGPLANLRSSTGCGIWFATDSPWVDLHVERLRHHQLIPVGMALEVQHHDGWRTTESGDLREQEGTVVIRLATGLAPGQVRPCVWHLPVISTCAIAGLAVAPNSTLAPATPPEPRWLAIGDSLTQGFSVQSPTATWVHRLSRRWDLPAWNLGIGGVMIEPLAFQWALDRQRWDLVTIALGSNHGWRESTVVTAADRAEALAEHALAGGHGKVVWILPPWKPMEDGKGPPEFMGIPLDRATGERIARVRDALRERLARFAPYLDVVEDLLPRDHRYYPDGLHPFAIGFAKYADALAGRIHPYG